MSQGLLRRLHAPGGRDSLVSRGETLDALSKADLAQFEETFVLSQAASGDDEAVAEQASPEDEKLAERPDFPLKGLHAKLFVSEFHHRARLWTGSANATNAAFGGNVEFLIELQGPRHSCGVDAVLQGQSGGVKLLDLLARYEPSGAPPPETEQERLEHRLDEARREIAALGFEARVVADKGDEENYELLFRSRVTESPSALRGIRARLWPIALGDASAKPLAPAFSKGVRFSPVSFGGLTAFFAIELEAESRGARASLRFVVTAVLTGAPANRYDRLLTAILRDQSDVLRYLVLLLADEQVASVVGSLLGSDGPPGDGWDARGGLPVLESMVRALARDPERLDHIARLLESLSASDEGRALIPDGLTAVWEPIWEARTEVAVVKRAPLDLSGVYEGLKDFQKETVDYVFSRLYPEDGAGASRFLVADEVGLGKTLVARGLIAKTIERLQKDVRRIDIVYVCSNAEIARQNIQRLNVTGKDDFALASRITLLPLVLHHLTQNRLNFVSFTPGTSLDLKSTEVLRASEHLLHRLLRKPGEESRSAALAPAASFRAE